MAADKSVGEQFAARLRQARTDRGVSQNELGRRCRLPRSSIYRLETGDREPRLSTVLLLAEALGMPVGDLVGDVRLPAAQRPLPPSTA